MKICLLDADSLIFYVCHNKKDEAEKSLEEVKQKLDTWLLDIFGKTYSTHYIMYLTEGVSFRKEIFTEYKSNRKGDKPNYFKEVKQYLRDKYSAVSYPGLEADDLCLITKNYFQREDLTKLFKDFEVFMSTPDKDILNLEGEHYNYRTGEWKYTIKDEALHFFWGSLIIGDPGDGVQGLKGQGKAAVKGVFEDLEPNEYYLAVLKSYIEFYGEYKGIQEYYKSYFALKILETHEEFEKVIPEPVLIKWEK